MRSKSKGAISFLLAGTWWLIWEVAKEIVISRLAESVRGFVMSFQYIIQYGPPVALIAIGTALLFDWRPKFHKSWRRNSISGEIWITDAFKFIASDTTGEIEDVKYLKRIGDLLMKFRHYASRGEMKIYGSVTQNDEHTRPIPAEYWDDNQIDIFSAMKGNPKETKTEARHGRQIQKYYGLKVKAEEIKKLSWK